jgi:acetolactate synthase-1/2/3 large subunit
MHGSWRTDYLAWTASCVTRLPRVTNAAVRAHPTIHRHAGAWQDARMPTGAQVIVKQLEEAGVEVCFGLPGVHNLPLWEALRESPIRLVGVRHEQAAAYAADGYARATGRLGVALTTTGPGAANTLGAVGEAWASRTPILVIATDIPSTLRREGVYRGVLHETAGQADMFRPVVVSARVAEAGDRLALQAFEAIEGARGGPSYLEVPTDLLGAEAESGRPVEAALDGVRDRAATAAAYELIEAAERPLVWAGSGSRDRADEVRVLAERLAAPVLTTYGARGVLPPEHRCSVGMPPHVPPAGRLWDEADLVIAFGSDLDGMNTQNWLQPQPPHVVAVNVDPEDAAKNYAVDAVVDALDLDRIRQRDGDVGARTRAVRAEACRELDERALRFLDAISYALPDDANVVCDMCIPGYWVAGFHGFHHPRKLQYPMGWGTLGFAFPAALGASLAGTGPTVSISGDGGFLFACGELATMAQERLPFTAVIVDDGGYGMLRYDQQLAGEAPYGVDLATPDFEALAESFGVRAETVEGLDDDFGDALSHHVEDPEPSVLVARAEALVPPPTTSPNWYRKHT